jgi:hypothetical protein
VLSNGHTREHGQRLNDLAISPRSSDRGVAVIVLAVE